MGVIGTFSNFSKSSDNPNPHGLWIKDPFYFLNENISK
jgi:hypothetical protein